MCTQGESSVLLVPASRMWNSVALRFCEGGHLSTFLGARPLSILWSGLCSDSFCMEEPIVFTLGHVDSLSFYYIYFLQLGFPVCLQNSLR